MKTNKIVLVLGLLMSASALQSSIPAYVTKVMPLLQGARSEKAKMFYLSTNPGDTMTIKFTPRHGESVTYTAKYGSSVNMSNVIGNGTFHITYMGKMLSPVHVGFHNQSYAMTGTLEHGHLLIEFWSPTGERIQSKKLKI